jgi:predicted RNase H-like HicB family nuclease
MIYPIFIFKTSDGFDGYFPDVEGCFFAGDSLADIPSSAEEAFGAHMEAIIEEGYHIPAAPKDPDAYLNDSRLSEDGGILGFVDIDPAKYEDKAIKFNLTMPRNLLTAIDHYIATTRGYKNRSQFMAEIAREKISH